MTSPITDTPAVRALLGRHGLPLVDETSVDAFLAPAQGEAAYALLFFAGNDSERVESTDVAVIMPQLLGAFAGRLRGAMVAPEAEAALKARFTVLMLPSLVLTKGEQILDVFPKIVDWSEYTDRIERHLNGTAAAAPLLRQ